MQFKGFGQLIIFPALVFTKAGVDPQTQRFGTGFSFFFFLSAFSIYITSERQRTIIIQRSKSGRRMLIALALE